jgi:hypothetical protein
MISKKHPLQYSLLCLTGGAIALLAGSTALQAAGFASHEARGDHIVWRLEKPPENTKAVTLKVMYTPNKLEEDSYVDTRTYSAGEELVYPFVDALDDGTYTWELTFVPNGGLIGYSPRRAEGPIDKNGREMEIVGKPRDTKERVYISNRGRDRIQTGSFTVIGGVIPEELQEEK